MKTIIDEAIKIYDKKGAFAVIEWGKRKNLPFHKCIPCDCQTPFYGHCCLVCGTFNMSYPADDKTGKSFCLKEKSQ